MPVRRSARLRSVQSPEDIPSNSDNQNNVNKDNKSQKNLDTVVEHEEPTVNPRPNTQSTPTAKVAHTPKSSHSQRKSPAKTPTTSLTRPAHFEMHPSKVQQSTTKQADSGLILGFNPVKKDAQGNVVKDPAQNTPSKTTTSPESNFYGTPALDFKFSSQESQLSDAAKKLMESVRQDVARNKANMVRENPSSITAGPSQNVERKIAKPTGKANRFSDVHMAQFKRMDSIAGHASAFRATPGRFQPVQKSLKRTNSKARLDEPESKGSPARTTPKASTPTTPSAKRVKQDKPETTPQNRQTNPKSAIARPKASVRSSLLTPTRSSMARASTSLKPPRTTMIPSLSRSPLSKPADAPSTPRTEFNPRFKSNIPTLSSLKSILRRHQPLFSKDPSKIAAGTHQTAPDFTPELLLRPSRESSHEPTAATPSPKKRVGFTPCTKPRPTEEVISPSPSKIPTTITYPSTSDVVYPTLPTLTPDRGSAQNSATIRTVRPSDAPVEATLPEIPGMPHGISHKKRHRAAEDDADRENVPPNGDHSQERSLKRVKVSTPEPSKLPASSPLKSRSHTPSRLGPGSARKGTPASARPRNRMLSMSRLNMLSQPKHRS
ncbi:uncharacterized protein APUU_40224S [Aspergillus puulaauensis]|uniref:Erythromycin esterase n=1 Tax=Aspergillus puulaauensis TaxID=1220207 RepID=A0A7R7XLM7_9EURO|nr:uncharacterized protein APUU_40224S [Aspergillus puulaauensis]BCS23780.1 hypothetical protein APUU_40224S [Aspergillus puulaauensis]